MSGESTPPRPSREELPGSEPGGTDPFGRPWERREEEPATAPASAPTSWPGASSPPPESPAQAPSYASWPGGTAQAPAVSGRPGGWAPRAGALIIDGIITTIIAIVPAALGAIGFAAGEGVGVALVLLGLAVGVLLALAYAPYMLAKHNGQTVGKKAMGVRVVDEHGRTPTLGKAVVREIAVKGLLIGFGGALTFYVVVLLNYLWPLWDEHNHALHDKLCRTQVVQA